jgi:hypothetical protein
MFPKRKKGIFLQNTKKEHKNIKTQKHQKKKKETKERKGGIVQSRN